MEIIEKDRIHFTFDISDRTAEAIRLLVNPPIQTQLNKIIRRLEKMPSQEEFDAQVAIINGKLDAQTQAIADESAQVAAFIAAHPDLDTSALQGVADRLDALTAGVTQIDPQ